MKKPMLYYRYEKKGSLRMASSYYSVYQGASAETEEKKSRFIATLHAVTTREEAEAFIAACKKKYPDARHNCSAFVIGQRQELTRCSDDGEPAQTAGRPMLDVLLREGITNVAVVVTRYFGGVLLGTGGLVRAYQAATQAGLMASVIIEKKPGRKLVIGTDYTGLGKLQYLFAQLGISILDTAYGADVELSVMVPLPQQQKVEKEITEKTSGSAKLEWGEEVLYAELEDKVMIFE